MRRLLLGTYIFVIVTAALLVAAAIVAGPALLAQRSPAWLLLYLPHLYALGWLNERR